MRAITVGLVGPVSPQGWPRRVLSSKSQARITIEIQLYLMQYHPTFRKIRSLKLIEVGRCHDKILFQDKQMTYYLMIALCLI
jgi:hypothetical protein